VPSCFEADKTLGMDRSPIVESMSFLLSSVFYMLRKLMPMCNREDTLAGNDVIGGYCFWVERI